MVYNGSEVQRIWSVGTRRLVAIPDDYSPLPRTISAYEAASNLSEQGGVDALYADFLVCALEDNKPEHMQRVRVAAVRNAIFRGRPFSK